MAVRWERAELQQSREQGVWDRWGVQDAEIRDPWVFFAFDQRRIYAPLEHPELPHQFARIATNAEALRPFVQDYGRLGWYELIGPQNRRRADPWFRKKTGEYQTLVRKHLGAAVYAEPLDWIQAHARTVAWCLAAGLALRIPNNRSRTQRCAELSQELPKPAGFGSTVGSKLMREDAIDKLSPLDFVGGMLEDYLWINLQGVRRRVSYVGQGRLRSLWGGDSLLESIYTLVTDAVTGGGRLAQCQACGAIFLQTDDRQRFCPPREGQTKSACMNRERVRRYRKQQSATKGENNGKPTRKR